VSYEVFLKPRDARISEAIEWLRRRPHYEAGPYYGAVYRNSETGVGFMAAVTEEEFDAPVSIMLRMDVLKPHHFALEVDAEISALLQHFDCGFSLSDDLRPLTDYSRDEFLRAWETLNRDTFARWRFGAVENGEIHAADPAQVEAVWRWNHGRAALQQEKGRDIFVPKIVWIAPSPGAAPVPTATLHQGLPALIPESLITHLVLARQKPPPPRKIFSLVRNEPPDPEYEFRLVGMESGIRLRGAQRAEINAASVVTTPAETLETRAMFAGPWDAAQFSIVPPEQVCGSDLIALMRRD